MTPHLEYNLEEDACICKICKKRRYMPITRFTRLSDNWKKWAIEFKETHKNCQPKNE